MKRPAKNTEQMSLAAKPVSAVSAMAPVAAPAVLPKELNYTPPGAVEPWRVERFDLLAVEFQMSAGAATWEQLMGAFHEFANARARTSGWFIARRLFGIMPLVPPADALPEDFYAHSRAEVCTQLGLAVEQLAGELELLRNGWQATESHAPVVQDAPVNPATARGELDLDDGLLKRFGFSERIFKISIYDPLAGADGKGADVARPDEENKIERDWFISKLRSREWQKMLDEPIASALARSALVNELYLRRLQDELLPLSPSSAKFKQLSSVKDQTEKQYQGQLESLQQKFPDLGVAGRVSARDCLSDLSQAHRDYYGHADRRLMDQVHTRLEIEFLLRTSAQMPRPRYRLGWTLAVIEARHGSLDPNFRSSMSRRALKLLDAGFAGAVTAARNDSGEKIVDLERGVMPGEGDDFPDFETKEPT